MKKVLIGIVFSLFSFVVHAEIEARIEPRQVRLGETFTLRLTHSDPQNGSIPNLVPLQKDFVILGTQRSMSYTVINGQSQSLGQWIIALRAKKAGTLTIPVITIGPDASKALSVYVSDGPQAHEDTPTESSAAKDVILSATVDENKPYVNQQIIYTVRLFNSKRLLDADYQPPQIDDALMVPLGEEKRYQMLQNNTNYIVEEQRYAIFPQKSGKLTLISPSFTAIVYGIDPQRVSVQDHPISLEVQPIPKNYLGKWLPAKSLHLDEEYEQASGPLNQGATVTRVIKIEGGGVPAQLLPNIEIKEGDGFTVYPEKGADNNQIKHGELYGSTELKVTYLLNKSGTITLPALRLPWFNTQTGKEEIAQLPAKQFQVLPAAAPSEQTKSPDDAKPNEVLKASVNQEEGRSTWPWIMAGFFAFAWAVTLIIWAWQKKQPSSARAQYKKALNELNKACSEGNPQRARDALLKWAQTQWPDAPLLNLTDLGEHVRDIHLKKQLHVLSQVLYKKGSKSLWRGDELLRAVRSLKPKLLDQKKKSKGLPPINPIL